MTRARRSLLFIMEVALGLAIPFPGKASTEPSRAGAITLTSIENGLAHESEFTCNDKIHGYLRLPQREVGNHILEGIWQTPNGQVLQHSRNSVDFPPPGRSTAYVWFAFPDRPIFGRTSPEADAERLTYNGQWHLDVLWDNATLVKTTFTVHCR